MCAHRDSWRPRWAPQDGIGACATGSRSALLLTTLFQAAGGTEERQNSGRQDLSQPHGESVKVTVEWSAFRKRSAVVDGAETHPLADGAYEVEIVTGYDGPTVFHSTDEDDLYIYRWHQHHWIIGEMNHHRGGPADSESDSSVPLGALYVAKGSDVLPPTYGWMDGEVYVSQRQGLEGELVHGLQLFVLALVIGCLLCRRAASYAAAEQNLQQQEQRERLFIEAGQRRAQEEYLISLARAQSMPPKASGDEFAVIGLLDREFWKRSSKDEPLPNLVKIQQPADGGYALGVVVSAAEPGEPVLVVEQLQTASPV